MRLRLRLFWLFIVSFWRERLQVLGESVLDMRVLPNDVDVSKITNDRYLAIMDLGRIDLVLRTGLFKIAVKRNWAPMVSCVCIRFRHPLKLFERYQLRTKIIYWDEETLYIQQQFVFQNRVKVTAYVCGTMLGAHGAVSPAMLFEALQVNPERPPMPAIVAELGSINASMHELQRDEVDAGGPG